MQNLFNWQRWIAPESLGPGQVPSEDWSRAFSKFKWNRQRRARKSASEGGDHGFAVWTEDVIKTLIAVVQLFFSGRSIIIQLLLVMCGFLFLCVPSVSLHLAACSAGHKVVVPKDVVEDSYCTLEVRMSKQQIYVVDRQYKRSVLFSLIVSLFVIRW